MFSSFLAPKCEALYAVGNVGTCDLQDFLLHVGSTGSLIYNASISLYFVATMKFGCKKHHFRKKFEFWCHLIPNGFALATGLVLLIKEYFNVGSKSCYIGAKPMYCIYSPYVECERGDEFAMQYGLWFSGVPFFIVFFVMQTFTFMIIHSLVLMKQKRDRWSLSGGNDSSACFRCLASVVTFPAKVKKLFERNSIDVSKSSLVDSSAAQASATSRLQHSPPHVTLRTVPNNKNAFSCHSTSNDLEIKIKKEY